MTMFGPAEDAIHGAYRDRARAALGARAFDRAYERGAQEAEDIVWELALASLN
jgi:hypothetical protein